MARAKIELKIDQVSYQKNLARRLRRGNVKIKVGDYVWLEVKNGTEKNKLGVHTHGSFPDLEHTTRTFVIQRWDMVKRVNSDRVS